MDLGNSLAMTAAGQLADEEALRFKQQQMATEVMDNLAEYDQRVIDKCPLVPSRNSSV